MRRQIIEDVAAFKRQMHLIQEDLGTMESRTERRMEEAVVSLRADISRLSLQVDLMRRDIADLKDSFGAPTQVRQS